MSGSSYTAELAYDINRRNDRTTIHCKRLLDIFPKFTKPFVDKYLFGPLSIINGLGIVAALLIWYIIILLPCIFYSKYIMRYPSIFNLPQATTDKKDINTSNTSIGSITAIKTLHARSQMYKQQSGGPDNIAPLIMNQLSLFGPNIPTAQLFTKVYSFLSRCNFYLTGRVFVDQLSECCFSKIVKFGEVGLLQLRTCWLDDVVDMFATENEDRKFNIVILGAGYDTRCYRLDSIKNNTNAKLYEVDAAGSQESKMNALNKANIDTRHVSFVSVDFESQDWMEMLQSKSDFDTSLPTLFVWEGVSYYLDKHVVLSTISKVSKCGRGSYIAFDYFDESCLNSTMRKSSKKIGEPLKYGIDSVDDFVRECREQSGRGEHELKVVDNLRSDELKDRYLAKSHGRYIGYSSEFGGFLMIGSPPIYTAKVLIAPSKSSIGNVLADQIVQTCQVALQLRDVFTIALSGGSLPSFLQTLSTRFEQANIDPEWRKWHVLLADERCVVSTDADSNLGSIRTNFTNNVPIPTKQIYGIDETFLKLSESTEIIAISYEEEVVKPLLQKCSGMLDCVVLGFGPDGHTCSLFPNHPLLNKHTRLVAPIDDSPKPPSSRITLTFKVLNKLSRQIIFCGAGSSKRPILEAVFENDGRRTKGQTSKKDANVKTFEVEMVTPAPFPCGMARPQQQGKDSLVWVVDKDASYNK